MSTLNPRRTLSLTVEQRTLYSWPSFLKVQPQRPCPCAGPEARQTIKQLSAYSFFLVFGHVRPLGASRESRNDAWGGGSKMQL